MAKLREVILLLVTGGPLPPRFNDHPLAGEWRHYHDCHIEPDWLLIYKVGATTSIWFARERIPICSEPTQAGSGHSVIRAVRGRAGRSRPSRGRRGGGCVWRNS